MSPYLQADNIRIERRRDNLMITPIVIVVGICVIFWAGAQYAINAIMKNMMKDLVECKDMHKWLKVWT